MRHFLITLTLPAALLAACGGADSYDAVDADDVAVVGADQTPTTTVLDTDDVAETVEDRRAENMVGTWMQDTNFTMTAAGQTFTIMNGEVEYDADGTSEIEAMLIIDGLPDGENSYRIELDGTYALQGSALTETFTEAEVEPVVANAKTRTIATAIEQALAASGTTESVVVRADEDVLVRRVDALGATLRYTR